MEQQKTIMTILVWTHLLVLISLETACTSLNTQHDLSSLGTEFMLGILGTTELPHTVVLNIVSTSISNVNITSPFSNLDLHYKVITYLSVNVSGEFSIRSNGSAHKGLFVQSDVPISVTVMPYGHVDEFEGFMALPVNVLSTEYIAASYQPYKDRSLGYNELLIVGVDDATVVNISGKHMDFKNEKIQRFETVQFISFTDISGTLISSNKPVAVFSGSSNSQIPLGTGDHQYLVEQLVPVGLWGYIYVIPPLYPRSHYLVRIFASVDNSTVIFAGKKQNITHTVDKGNFLEQVVDNGPTLVMSNKPVSVMQYLYETYEPVNGDPFMATVQSVSQFRHSYTFGTGPRLASYANENLTLAVTIETTNTDHLLLNDNDGNLINNFVSVGQVREYSVLTVNLTYDNFYSINHTDNKPFGLLLYGLPHLYVGFGYPLAMNFTRNGINGIVNRGPMCFDCNHRGAQDSCGIVKQCALNEKCIVEKHISGTGDYQYKQGCATSCGLVKKSVWKRDVPLCTKCCSSDFCNNNCTETISPSIIG